MNEQPSGPRHGRTVVVGVDGSDSALRAVSWAAVEAVRRNIPVRPVTAFSWPHDHAMGQVGLGARYRDIMLDAARRQLADATAVAKDAGAVEVEPDLVVGYPVPVLRAEARRAELVVLGDRGYGGVSGLLLGSVSTALSAAAACPVVLVRESPEPGAEPRGPVVVGVDGSRVSEAAVEFAFEAASLRNVGLVAVHTWMDFFADPAVSMFLDWDAIEAGELQVLAERLSGWGAKYPDVLVERVVARDRPAHALVEQSRTAQLVVVGSHGHGAATGLIFGSVSHAVLHKARCSVAIVRPPAETDQ